MLVKSHPNGGMPRGARHLARPLSGGPDPGPPKKKPGPGKHGALGGHIGLEGGEKVLMGAAKSALVDLKTEAHQAASDAVDTALAPTQQAAHHALSTGLLMAGGALGVASGGLGLYMLRLGLSDLREGISHRNAVHGIEGANSMVVGVRSLAAGVSLAAHLAPDLPWLATLGHAAHTTLAPLGILHGSVDVGLGLYDVVRGARAGDARQVRSGLLDIGTGAALATAAAGGGTPALITAGVFLAGKVVHSSCCPAKPH